jgi:chemosensory pili system protein ChpC
MSKQAVEQTENFAILLLNIEGTQLILPDIAVAEIIEFQAMEAGNEDAPIWFLGEVEWRGLTIPVVSLEAMNHGSFFSHNNRLKIVVINSMSQSDFKYWAFVAQETPKLLRINSESLVNDSAAEFGEMQAVAAELYGEPVLIPDLEKIETAIGEEIINL